MGWRALGSMAVVLVLGCGPSTGVRPAPAPVASAAPAAPPGRAEAATAGSESRARTPEPASLTGTIFLHCAYGPPNFGENPQTDSKEPVALLVLEQPLPELCASDEREPQCIRGVSMLQVAPTDRANTLDRQTILGRHLRVVVAEYSAAFTGHHHTRMLGWYDKLQDLGPAKRISLRASWPDVAPDFLGTSCPDYPPRFTPAGLPLGGHECVGNGAGSCAAGLTCFALESSPNGRGVCAVEATVEELATRTRYEGALVGVRHATFGSSTVCTDMACACCNSCTNTTPISDGTKHAVLAARSSGEPYLIKADQCAIKTMSSGLPSGPHVIVGIVRSTETAGTSLQIKHLIPEQAGR